MENSILFPSSHHSSATLDKVVGMEARYSDRGICIIEILPVGLLMPGSLSNGALVPDALYKDPV